MHIKKHETKDNFKCAECPMVFQSQKQLESHLKSHIIKQKIKLGPLDVKSKHPMQIKPLYECKFCNKNFLYESSIKRHLKLENCKAAS